VDTSGICKLVGVALHFKTATQPYMELHTDSGIFLLLKVKIYFHSASAYLAREKPQFWGEGLLGAKNFGGLGSCYPSLRPSVRHSLAQYENYSSYDCAVFTAG